MNDFKGLPPYKRKALLQIICTEPFPNLKEFCFGELSWNSKLVLLMFSQCDFFHLKAFSQLYYSQFRIDWMDTFASRAKSFVVTASQNENIYYSNLNQF